MALAIRKNDNPCVPGRLCLLVGLIVASGLTIPAAQAQSPKSDLVIVTKAPGNRSAAEMRDIFDTALKILRSDMIGDFGELTMEPIDVGRYRLMKLLIESPENFVPGLRAMAELEPFEEDPNGWTVRQKNPHERLTGITVKYRDEEGVQRGPLFVPVQDANAAKARFSTVRGFEGRYKFRSEPGWKMQGYRLHTKSPQGDLTDVKLKEWPEKSRHYIVRIADFEGGTLAQNALFKAIEKNFLDGLANISNVRPGLFSIANFRGIYPGVQSTWNGNLFTVRFPRFLNDKNQQADRVWMLFPLARDERDMVVNETRRSNRTPKRLAEDFERTAINLGQDLFHTVVRARDDSEATPLPPQGGASWFEVPAVRDKKGRVQYFQRSFKVENINGWLRLFNGKPAHLVTIYEGAVRDDQGNPIAKWVPRVDGQLWQSQPVTEWLDGLKKLVRNPDEKKQNKK